MFFNPITTGGMGVDFVKSNELFYWFLGIKENQYSTNL